MSLIVRECLSLPCSTTGQYDSVPAHSLSLLVIQLQLEIALLQGELQTEKTQLHRQTQRLKALKEESTKKVRSSHTDRKKVNFRVAFLFLFAMAALSFCSHLSI